MTTTAHPLTTNPAACRHRGRLVGVRWWDRPGLLQPGPVYHCAVHGSCSVRHLVRGLGSTRPDWSVAVCYGCTQHEHNEGQ